MHMAAIVQYKLICHTICTYTLNPFNSYIILKSKKGVDFVHGLSLLLHTVAPHNLSTPLMLQMECPSVVDGYGFQEFEE